MRNYDIQTFVNIKAKTLKALWSTSIWRGNHDANSIKPRYSHRSVPSFRTDLKIRGSVDAKQTNLELYISNSSEASRIRSTGHCGALTNLNWNESEAKAFNWNLNPNCGCSEATRLNPIRSQDIQIDFPRSKIIMWSHEIISDLKLGNSKYSYAEKFKLIWS